MPMSDELREEAAALERYLEDQAREECARYGGHHYFAMWRCEHLDEHFRWEPHCDRGRYVYRCACGETGHPLYA